MIAPRSIAIVGASAQPHKMAGRLIPALEHGGFSGRIYPVNQRYERIGDLPCYPSVARIGERVDLCIISVPATAVATVLHDCEAAGVMSGAIFTSGFREVGDLAAEAVLHDAASRMPFLGPNCMGLANVVDGIIATPSAAFEREDVRGSIAIVSQSGGLGFGSLLYTGLRTGMGFSHVFNIGNGVGVRARELCAELERDGRVRALGVILEDAEQVADLLAVPWSKPLVLLKLGRGATGAEMARSHTGSHAGSYAVVKALCGRSGVAVTTDLDDFLAALSIASSIPVTSRTRYSAFSISGGNVTLFADSADEAQLALPEFAPSTTGALRDALPSFITIHNPLDITAAGFEDPALHRTVLAILQNDPNVDVVIPILTTARDYSGVARLIVDAHRAKPNVVVLWVGGSYDGRALELLRENGIPVVRFAQTLARGLKALGERRSPGIPLSCARPAIHVSGDGAVNWNESRSWSFLQAHGIETPPLRTGRAADLEAMAREIGYPLVVKVDSATTHIAAEGGVFLDLRTAEDLRRVAAVLGPDREVIVMRHVRGSELFVALVEDAQFGPLLVIASGGTLTDDIADSRILPADAPVAEIEEAIGSTLVGRKAMRADRAVVSQAAERIARVAGIFGCERGRLSQIEMNPFMIGAQANVPVDVFVVEVRDGG